MAESKRIFQSGRMNLDLDDRLIPNGEYRYAQNVNIGRSEGADIGAIENLLGNELIAPTETLPEGSETIGVLRDNGGERIYFFITNNESPDETNSGEHSVYEFNQIERTLTRIVSGSWLNFHKNFRITGINLVDTLLFWTDDRNEPRKINIDVARANPSFYTGDELAAVIKLHPVDAPTITSASVEDRPDPDDPTGTLDRSQFLERRLIRFAYRYKFRDGEFSPISPFSTTCFDPRPDNSTPYAIRAASELVNSGEDIRFVNRLQSIGIQVNVPEGHDIIEVELIWKEQASPTVYILEAQEVTGVNTIDFTYTGQDPFRALPGSQVTRVSDAVPRLAKAQEVAGGRIMYGNFLHQFNLPPIDFDVSINSSDDARHPIFRNHSVKSRRSYQVGLTLIDRFGRQTPVILSNNGNDTLTVTDQVGTSADAFQALRVSVTNLDQIRSLAPWATHIRAYVKQREVEYYNVFTSPASGTNDPNGSLNRFGDTVNKVPIDSTQAAGGTNAPSNTQLYPKLNSANANVRGELRTVQNVDVVNQNFIIADDDPAAVVYETSGVESQLDIYFETSTTIAIPANEDTSINFDIDFFNCYLIDIGTTAHIEANRIRMGFNEPFFDVGVKASLVVEEYAEERRFNALIHSSGLFNSRTGINGLNQFNIDEGGLTLGLDPSDGSVQKLFAEDTQVIIWQEDKVSRSPIDKDFIYSAEGGAVPVTSNTQYLGTVAPYAGEYGISTDPDSFAVYGTRKYFTDKNRGVVLRLANDGLSEISKVGMNDFFRDALRTSTRITGSFDEYHDVYNLTIVGDNYGANPDTDITTGREGYFTVAFEEDVNGWSSFKTFMQEGGTTLNNRFYTFSGGQIWEHNSTNVTRNNFYGQFRPSDVEFVFNDSPSLVKHFKTLGYEGSGAWDCDFFQVDQTVLPNSTTPDPLNTVTLTLDVSGFDLSDGTATRVASLSGARPIEVIPGQSARWILVLQAITPLEAFTDINQITANLSGGLTPMVSLNPERGQAFIMIDVPMAPDSDTTYTLTGSAVPVSVLVGDLLTLTVLENVANAFASPTGISFSTSDLAMDRMFTFRMNPSTITIGGTTVNQFYFNATGNIEVNTGNAPVVGTPALTLDGDSIDTAITVTAPTAMRRSNITVGGSLFRYSIKRIATVTQTIQSDDYLVIPITTPTQLAEAANAMGRNTSDTRSIVIRPSDGFEFVDQATTPISLEDSPLFTEVAPTFSPDQDTREALIGVMFTYSNENVEADVMITAAPRRIFETTTDTIDAVDNTSQTVTLTGILASGFEATEIMEIPAMTDTNISAITITPQVNAGVPVTLASANNAAVFDISFDLSENATGDSRDVNLVISPTVGPTRPLTITITQNA